MMVDCTDLIGTPFETLNCWQLVRELYSRNGVDLKDYDIGVDECQEISRVYAEELDQLTPGQWLRIQAPEDLCIIPMRHHPKFISHCGLYIGAGRFIHSLQDTGVIVNRLDDPRWRHKIAGFYRYVG